MNENHERGLLATFRHIDNLLAEAEQILATAGSMSPFAEYTQDSTPVQRKVLHDYIERVRQAMACALADLRLSRPAPVCGAIWAAGARFTFAQVEVAEMEPQRLRGYGPLSAEDVKAINEVVAELNATLERLIAYWNQGPDAGLQARFARLGKTTDEARLLRELERVATAHGLIEFRGALRMLLERLENPVFEIGVFGRVSSGKSSLLNHLVGGTVLPVGVTPVTAFPTRLSYGPEARATIAFAEGRPEVVEPSRLAEFVTEPQNPGNRKHVARVSAELPSPRLREGVIFVDTPGLGSLATAGAEETAAYLPRCDLGLVLVDAGSSLTHEDLAMVQALYQSGAQAMVLVSKADLLSPTELRQTTDYVERQLAAQANLKLRAHPVSVLGPSAALCNEWLEQELRPLVESHREQAAAALKRKIGALREAIVRVLQTRLGRAEGARLPASPPSDEEAIAALRKAEACLETARRNSEPVLDRFPSLSDEILEAVAADLAGTRASPEAADAGGTLRALAGRVLGSQVRRLVENLAAARLELAQALRLAHEAVPGASGQPEALPAPAEAPTPDLTPLTAGLILGRPVLLSLFGKGLIRRHLRRRLETEAGPAMRELLDGYRRKLREWYPTSLAELRDGFAACAAVYRAQLEQRGSPARIAETRTELEADLRALQDW
ncbi:MAG TPA: dynamin family protein [Dongiaceae bacterium]|nr:dynamin family protein [Dongiaceae bacterium]